MNWMKKVAVALVCLLPLGLQAAKVDTLQVKSPSMNKSIEVVVVSPDMAATEACPVIYLLHGYGGNARTWVGIKPDLPKIADEKGIFFVCPDGKNTWYWDSPLNADVRYETFISDELVKYVDSHYKTVADRRPYGAAAVRRGGVSAHCQRLRDREGGGIGPQPEALAGDGLPGKLLAERLRPDEKRPGGALSPAPLARS